jgi:hypothetical protein
MAPKPKDMAGETRVFYWADTGPVECKLRDGAIVEAKATDGAIIALWQAEA